MRRDPAATFLVTIMAIGVAALVAGIGVLVVNGQAKAPSDTWYWVGRTLIVAGAMVAVGAVIGLVLLALEHRGIHLRLRWPIELHWPIYRTTAEIARVAFPAPRPSPQPSVLPPIAASSGDLKPRVAIPATKLEQRGAITVPVDVSRFTPEILARIDAILGDSPIPNCSWHIEDKLGKHQSESLAALRDDVVWETVTSVILFACVIPGGPYAAGQTASLTLSSGLKTAEYLWSDPALGPALQRTAYRIEECFADGQAGN